MRRLVVVLSLLGAMAAGAPTTAFAQDSAEANEDLVRQLYDAYNGDDLDALDTIVAPDIVDHNAAPGQAPGLEGVKQALAGFRAAFSGDVMIDDLIASGDEVADRIHVDGTHTGAFFGIPATGKPVHIEAIEIWRIQDGQIVEGWHIENILQLLIQVGAVPSPGGGGGATPMAMSTPAMTPPVATPPAGDVATAANMDIVRRYYEAVNAGDLDAFDTLIAADAVDHNPSLATQAPGREGIRQAITALRTAFPDYQVTAEDMFAAGDLVVVRSVARGTQDGPLARIPPSGKPVEFGTMDIWRVRDGQIVDVWHVEELLNVLIQIGAVPLPGGPATPVATPD